MNTAVPILLEAGKKVFFASDFHLGAPNADLSLVREKKIIHWLNTIAPQAQTIFLVGDIFDFWFEYKHTIPKGFIRFQGKLAELVDQGIEVILFTGNHDMWMFDYFPEHLGIKIYRHPQVFYINDLKIFVGHGDGLGPGDGFYKILKKVFKNPFCQWVFRWLHPNLGMALANYWSRHSRTKNLKKGEEKFMGEDNEWLLQFSKHLQAKQTHDFYIFGHRHLPLDLPVSAESRYINLGEWLTNYTYAECNGSNVSLKKFEP